MSRVETLDFRQRRVPLSRGLLEGSPAALEVLGALLYREKSDAGLYYGSLVLDSQVCFFPMIAVDFEGGCRQASRGYSRRLTAGSRGGTRVCSRLRPRCALQRVRARTATRPVSARRSRATDRQRATVGRMGWEARDTQFSNWVSPIGELVYYGNPEHRSFSAVRGVGLATSFFPIIRLVMSGGAAGTHVTGLVLPEQSQDGVTDGSLVVQHALFRFLNTSPSVLRKGKPKIRMEHLRCGLIRR